MSFQATTARFHVAFVLMILITIGVLDHVLGADLTLRALYVVPVGLAAWTGGRRSAFALCTVSVGLCFYFDTTSGLTRARPIFVYSDAIVRLFVYLAATVVVSRLREAQRKLDELARTDLLTGLYNRRGFGEIAERELRRAQRTKAPLVMVGIDLDEFKVVNDTAGHAEGDRVLVAVAEVLKAGRGTDLAARLGGDEFAILLTGTEGERADRAIERIRTALLQRMKAGDWPVTFSLGVAKYACAPPSVEEMLKAADSLMYEAKRTAKGTTRHGEYRPREESTVAAS